MNTLKGWISTTVLIATVALGTVPAIANGGILVGNRDIDPQPPCSQPKGPDWAIIVGNATGNIVGNLTGILVGNLIGAGTGECGSADGM